MLTFEEWMEAVDQEVFRLVSCSVHDLADFCSRDLYEDCVTPEEAALEALDNDDLPWGDLR